MLCLDTDAKDQRTGLQLKVVGSMTSTAPQVGSSEMNWLNSRSRILPCLRAHSFGGAGVFANSWGAHRLSIDSDAYPAA